MNSEPMSQGQEDQARHEMHDARQAYVAARQQVTRMVNQQRTVHLRAAVRAAKARLARACDLYPRGNHQSHEAAVERAEAELESAMGPVRAARAHAGRRFREWCDVAATWGRPAPTGYETDDGDENP